MVSVPAGQLVLTRQAVPWRPSGKLAQQLGFQQQAPAHQIPLSRWLLCKHIHDHATQQHVTTADAQWDNVVASAALWAAARLHNRSPPSARSETQAGMHMMVALQSIQTSMGFMGLT